MVKHSLLLLTTLLTLFACNEKQVNHIPNSAEDYHIIPKPQSVEMMDGRFMVNHKTKVSAKEGLKFEADYLAELLSQASGSNISSGSKGNIHLRLDNSLAHEEEYIIEVKAKEIKITGKTTKAVFYGIQSLLQLLPPQTENDKKLSIPAGIIKDAPRFAYRGMHLDVSRHFFSTDFVKQYIDFLAMHKMNTFHWHLTEDQGWRIEIKAYPKLTEVGAWRNGTIVGNYPGSENDNKRDGGFYTQEEIKEIIAYATERHITIIPEIELPGHSSAAIAAYPFLSCFPEEPSVVPNDMMSEASKQAQANGQPKIVQESWGVYHDVYCAGDDATFEFIENVLTEVIDLFPSKYIHIGGDECPKGNWKRCPKCQKRKQEENLHDEHELQSYFITRVEKFVNSKGRNIIGWDEILEGGLAPKATVMSWRGTKGGLAASRAHHNVIMSPNSHCYFDHYQSENREEEPLAIGGFLPVEKVYSFDPIPEELEEENQKYILGGQANLWTEYIDSEDKAEYMLFPRMTALSEALWTSPAQKDWTDFRQRLDDYREVYDALGVNYAKHVFEEEVLVE